MAKAEKQALVAQLALQRSQMAATQSALKTELSVSRQVKKSLHRNPTPWIAGSFVTFVGLGLLLRRKKVIYKGFPIKRGIIRRTSRLVLTLARPAVTTWALKKAKDYAESRVGPLPDNSMLGGPPQK